MGASENFMHGASTGLLLMHHHSLRKEYEVHGAKYVEMRACKPLVTLQR